VLDGKVAAPVRVGMATAIPAGSQAAITVVPGFYSEENSGNKRRQVENAVKLSAVIVGGVKYNVVTSSIKLIPPTAAGLDAEVGFVLIEPLDIQE